MTSLRTILALIADLQRDPSDDYTRAVLHDALLERYLDDYSAMVGLTRAQVNERGGWLKPLRAARLSVSPAALAIADDFIATDHPYHARFQLLHNTFGVEGVTEDDRWFVIGSHTPAADAVVTYEALRLPKEP